MRSIANWRSMSSKLECACKWHLGKSIKWTLALLFSCWVDLLVLMRAERVQLKLVPREFLYRFESLKLKSGILLGVVWIIVIYYLSLNRWERVRFDLSLSLWHGWNRDLGWVFLFKVPCVYEKWVRLGLRRVEFSYRRWI